LNYASKSLETQKYFCEIVGWRYPTHPLIYNRD